MAKKKMVVSTFTVSLIEYLGPDASPTTAANVEEVVLERLCDSNQCTAMVSAVGKPKVIVEGVA